MRTTDDIITDLNKRAEGGEDVRQQVIAHQALARLRTERAEHAKDKARVRDLDAQITFWLGLVDEDVDERVADKSAKDTARRVDAAASDKA